MIESDPWKVGRDHERSATPERRRQRGAFYTPKSVVEGLLRLAVPDSSDPDHLPSSILDPTCGGGAFLVGSLDRMVELGLDAQDAFGRVSGIDIDPGAVAATQDALAIWAAAHGITSKASLTQATGRVILGDALAFAVSSSNSGGGLPDSIPVPDLIVGNPPFATPLKGTEFPDTAVAFRESRPDLFGPYADLAAIHVQSAIQLCGHVAGGQARSGAQVAFVLPQSILASRDTEGLRNRLAQIAPLRSLWATAEAMFEANVRVCAVVLELAGQQRDESEAPAHIIIAGGPDVSPIATAKTSESWASLAARALGAPGIQLNVRLNSQLVSESPYQAPGQVLGDMVTATAGFRDEYYALASACRELSTVSPKTAPPKTAPPKTAPPKTVRITTVGSLDPLISWWGERPIRFAKKSWDRPVVDMAALEDDVRMYAWLQSQLRPKVLLPTQSKVFEPVIDRDGTMAPVTPVLSIHVDPENLDRVAAVFLAPPIVAWAYSRWFGTALSVQAIKIAARDISSFPRPSHEDLWDQAAELIAACGQTHDSINDPDQIRLQVIEIAKIMNQAYDGSQDTFDWWFGRLP